MKMWLFCNPVKGGSSETTVTFDRRGLAILIK